MALDMSGAMRKSKKASIDVTDSSELKKLLSESQKKRAKDRFYNVLKAFAENGCPLDMDDNELAELIRVRIIKTTLSQEF